MKRICIYSITAVFLFTACKEDKQVADLTGDWDNFYIKVETVTMNNTDSSSVLEVGGTDWQTKLKMNRIRTSFRADSTWNSAHYNLKDSIVYNPTGKWWVVGDSLYFQQLTPSTELNAYKFSIRSDTVTFDAMYDWDGDGKKDDHYFGRQVRVKK